MCSETFEIGSCSPTSQTSTSDYLNVDSGCGKTFWGGKCNVPFYELTSACCSVLFSFVGASVFSMTSLFCSTCTQQLSHTSGYSRTFPWHSWPVRTTTFTRTQPSYYHYPRSHHRTILEVISFQSSAESWDEIQTMHCFKASHFTVAQCPPIWLCWRSYLSDLLRCCDLSTELLKLFCHHLIITVWETLKSCTFHRDPHTSLI